MKRENTWAAGMQSAIEQAEFMAKHYRELLLKELYSMSSEHFASVRAVEGAYQGLADILKKRIEENPE